MSGKVRQLEVGDYVEFEPTFIDYFTQKYGWNEAKRVGYERTRGEITSVNKDRTVDVRYFYTFTAGPHGDEKSGVDTVLAAHLRRFTPTTEDLLWMEDYEKDEDGWARTTDDSDAVEKWIRLHPDADLFDTIVAENIAQDDPDLVDEEWTLDRVGRALRQLVRLGVLQDGGTLSAGAHFIRSGDDDEKPSVADEDTDDEMLTITACREGEVFDGATVTNVETGAVVGILVHPQTYEQMQRLTKAIREQRDAASLIPKLD